MDKSAIALCTCIVTLYLLDAAFLMASTSLTQYACYPNFAHIFDSSWPHRKTSTALALIGLWSAHCGNTVHTLFVCWPPDQNTQSDFGETAAWRSFVLFR